MKRSRLIAVLVLGIVAAGGAAARTLIFSDAASNSTERQALRNIETHAQQDIAERMRHLSSPDAISGIQAMKREMYIDLLETKRSFARERGDLKTEQEAEAALGFWTGTALPVLSESPQPFDKSEGGTKP